MNLFLLLLTFSFFSIFISYCTALKTFVLNHPHQKYYNNDNSSAREEELELDRFFDELLYILEDDAEYYQSPFYRYQYSNIDHSPRYYRNAQVFDYDEFIKELDEQHFKGTAAKTSATKEFNWITFFIYALGISATITAVSLYLRRKRCSYKRIDEKSCDDFIVKTQQVFAK